MNSNMVLKALAVANGLVWSVALGTQLDYIPGILVCSQVVYASIMVYRKVVTDEVDA